ncbi:MAG: N-acetyl-gamma-glutamyl-phosphate reductase [Chitinivibrionales bacterium]
MAGSVGILGATSYTGRELIRLISLHREIDIKFLSSVSHSGKGITEVFPELLTICDMELVSPEDALKTRVSAVFSCLPHAVSAGYIKSFADKGIKVVDLSADFRLKDVEVYEKWYNKKHPCPELIKERVYGLPEINRERIAEADIIANPGCFPTGILLPLIPVLRKKSGSVKNIISDSKTGVSGAGRTLKQVSHYVEANESISGYSIGRKHRHTPEIEQEISIACGDKREIVFSPHLTPMERGILSTIYLETDLSAQECLDITKERYKQEPFIRVRDLNDLPSTSYVRHTNLCDFSFTESGRQGMVICVSAIDNLLRGASSQALQNMNIMMQIPEMEGLTL